MTGGTGQATQINSSIAQAVENLGLGMGLEVKEQLSKTRNLKRLMQ